MADVITRFKLETNQFDSKLRDAAKSLSDLTHQLSMGGKDFERFAKEHVNTAKSFGEVASGATNLKDKLKDLVSAYNQVAKSYNVLSKDQQQTDFGKAMAESLQTLQQRIKDTKTELNSAPGFVDKLTERFTVNIDALKLFSIGLQAAEGALKVAKDAFFASEANVDEWGRTIASAQSVYEGFLTAINTGDISGYLSRIDEIVKAARKAYDEIDRLGTMKTIQSPQMDKQNAENTRLRTMLMTGRYIAPAAGSGLKALMADGTQLTPAQMKRLEQQLQNGMQTIVKLTGNELEQTGKAINAYYDKLAKQNGMTMEEFRKGTSSMAEFDKRLEMSRKYSEFETAHTTTITSTGSNGLPISVSRRDNAVNPYEQYKGWATFRVDKQGENSYNELVGLIRQQQQQTGQLYSTIGQAYRTINRTEGTTVRNLMNGGTGGSGSGGKGTTKTEITYATGSIAAQEAEVSRLTKLWKEAGDAVRDDYALQLSYAKQQLSEMTGGFNPDNVRPIADMTGRIPTPDFGSDWKKDKNGRWYDATAPVAPDKIQFSDSLQKFLDNFEKQQMKSGNETVKALEKFNGDVSKITGGVGSIVSGLQQMGVEIPSEIQNVLGVLTGMSTIMSGITSILSLILIAENIQTTESTIKSIPIIGWALARGGVVKAAMGYEVPGNHYSGDMVPALLNSGETVLNRAQSGILAAQLEGTGNGFKNGQIVGVIEGERLKLVLNNHFRRIGQGELVTW